MKILLGLKMAILFWFAGVWRRELLQCQFWSIEFRTIFWGWSILISFCFVQVLEHCLWRGEGVGCALVVRLLGPGAGLGLRAAGHRAAPLLLFSTVDLGANM